MIAAIVIGMTAGGIGAAGAMRSAADDRTGSARLGNLLPAAAAGNVAAEKCASPRQARTPHPRTPGGKVRSFKRITAVVMATGIAVAGSLTAASPAQADFRGCPDGYVCIYSGNEYAEHRPSLKVLPLWLPQPQQPVRLQNGCQ